MPGAILRSRVTDEIERAPAGLQDWPDDIIASDNELKKHGKYVCNISKTLGSDTGSIKRDDERAQVWKILDEKKSMQSTESSVLMCHLTKREGKSNRVCGKLFRRKEHLTRHMKTASVHNERGYGPCAVFGCGKSSSCRDNLQDHYWTHLHKNGRSGRNKKLSLEELRNILCPDEETLYLRLAQRLRDHQNREKKSSHIALHALAERSQHRLPDCGTFQLRCGLIMLNTSTQPCCRLVFSVQAVYLWFLQVLSISFSIKLQKLWPTNGDPFRVDSAQVCFCEQ